MRAQLVAKVHRCCLLRLLLSPQFPCAYELTCVCAWAIGVECSRSRSAILWVLIKGRGVRISDVEAATYREMGWGTPAAPPPWPQHKLQEGTTA